MREIQLTRRKLLSITATGTLIILLDSCGGGSTIPTSYSTPSSQSSNRGPRFSPGSITPTGLGVNIHFTKLRQGEAKMIADAGFGFVRMDFPWSDIERQKGKFDFSTQLNLVGLLLEQGIFTLAVLAYGNPLYDNSKAPFHIGPTTKEVQQAFARFAKEAAMNFKDYCVIWEIWNEPNNPDFWQLKPSADDYVKLAKVAIEAIRGIDPHVRIIAPAITTFPQNLDFWNFLEYCFAQGLLDQIDAVSIHPYRYDKRPETAFDDYKRLRSLIASHASDSKKSIKIYSSEWGYPITAVDSKDLQAAYLVRQFLINCMNEIPLSIWYDWHDDGQDPQNIQNTFGVLDWNYHPKPAYLGVQTLMQQLNGFHFNENLLSSEKDYVVRFTKGKSEILVLWTVDNPHPVRIFVDVPSITVVSMTGETRSLTPTNGAIVMDLTSSPQYLLTGNSVPKLGPN